MRRPPGRVAALVSLIGMIVALVPASLAVADGPIYINEIQVSTAGDDWEFVEIQGESGTDLSGYTLVGIESDSGTSMGTIDLAYVLSGSIPGDGLWLAISAEGASVYGAPGDAVLAPNSFENSTATYFLVSGFSGAVDDDLDADDDGVLDTTPWTAVADSLTITDGGSGDADYGAAAVVGPDGSFLPSGAYRCPDAPTGVFSTDNIHNFSVPDGTPGDPNSNCPAPPEPPAPYLISEIQGSGTASPLQGVSAIITGVVVGDFQGTDQIGGFFVQEERSDSDHDRTTSEGIFVNTTDFDVSAGDIVTVTGVVEEDFDRTQITDVADVEILDHQPWKAYTTRVHLPVVDFDYLERYEGMLVKFPQRLYISEFFNYDRFGEIVLTTHRQYQGTQIAEPGDAANAIAEANALARITLDDGLDIQNPEVTRHPNGDPFTLDNNFRGGDVVKNATGVLDDDFGYRIQPTKAAKYYSKNKRPTEVHVRGTIKVATFNVLNFFTNLDDGVNDLCGPTGDLECRGADSEEEFDRQLAKLVSGIIALDADIVGLEEIENDILETDGNRAHNPVLTLVEALNDAEGVPGTWAWVGAVDHYNDYPIRNEIVYKPASVSPVGGPRTIADPAFDQTRPGDTEPVGRPPVAQTFRVGDPFWFFSKDFTVIVNHFKSKGSSCESLGDPDIGDGQGECNLTRVAQSEALLAFAADIQEDTFDNDILIIGDLNSYSMEDPVDTIEAGLDGNPRTGDDYQDLLWKYEGRRGYGYVFDGQLGSLDQVLASRSMAHQVRDTAVFHINADEPDLLDYDTTFKSDGQDALYEPLPYRVSDHDPVIVGIDVKWGFNPGLH